ncbi:MAG: signal recognition particle-docking protein FtsY [Succinivibrionaceae bacterium]|nr:signal recognition particle-docking protein FtsY [Succinivibrionaceae bacterium]MDY6273622.1 signal recognition particle-docking protein FtsY [Succinivibrionaceae bacterium]MDY6335602.1 signal recognition particle-docking protein FtsY [Succinivibrionaceae bacterium]
MGFLSRFTNLFKKKSGEAETAEAKESEEGKAQAEAEVAAQANAAESAPVSEAKPQAAAAEEKKPAEEKAESAPEPSPKKSSRLIDDSIRESGSTAAKETVPEEKTSPVAEVKPETETVKVETEEPAPEAVKVEAEEPAAEPAPAEKAEAAPAAEPAPEKPAKARSTAKKASSAKKKAPAAKKPAGEKTAASAKGTAKKSSAAKKPAAKKTASKKAAEPRKPEAEAAAPAAEPDEKAESAKAPAKKAAESKSEEKKPAARKSAAKKAPAPAAEAEPEKKDQAAPAEQEPEKAESVSQTAGTPEAPAAGAEPEKKDQGEPAEAEPEKSAKKDEPEEPQSRFGLFRRLVSGLSSSGKSIGYGLSALFRGRKIDEELYTDLEERLVMADISYNTAEKILERVKDKAKLKDLRDADALTELVKSELLEILRPVSSPLIVQDRKPFVILMVGVNGAGKTTTIGKMASAFKNKGMEVVLAAGDTFRAAAVEQLNVWGVRNDVRVVAQATGADSASVIFDAYSAAKASGADVLIADTAGRLQNKENLMRELAKIVKVLKKHDPDAPHEVLLTLDAGIGQNAISQVRQFNGTVPVTGICLTKLDGTAKGGVIFSIADEFRIPVRYIGVGEGISDLREFNAGEFIDALFDGGNK